MSKDFDYKQMLEGKLYMYPGIHKENNAEYGRALAQKINNLPMSDRDEIVRMEKELFGSTGENIFVNPPLFIDYGKHIHMGENVYCNMGCTFLDVNSITIGNNVMLGPNVSLYTAGHQIDPEVRITTIEFGYPIVIEDNVWIGGNATVVPGVTIGKNSVVAAGSVVTKDVPANVVVGGNPAKVIRAITEEDELHWRKFEKEYFEDKAKFNENNK